MEYEDKVEIGRSFPRRKDLLDSVFARRKAVHYIGNKPIDHYLGCRIRD